MSRVMRVITLVALSISMAAPFSVVAETPRTSPEYPRVANLFYRWDIKPNEVADLAKWDVLLVDMEVQTFTPESLRQLRIRNPNIIILAYITPQEIRRDAGELSGTLRQKLYRRITPYHWLSDLSGERVSWWPGTWMLNVTDQTTPAPARSWKQTLVSFLDDEVLSTGLWDGVFYDNLWDNVTWIGDKRIDLNGDGRSELGPVLNTAWRRGMIDLLELSRAQWGNQILLFGNTGFSYYPYLNGVVFENFPRALGWHETLRRYAFFLEHARAPRFAVLNGNANNQGRPTARSPFQQVTAASLLHDGYASYDNGDQSHAEMWWDPVYATSLGAPLGPAETEGGVRDLGAARVWRRDFERGVVVVNSTAKPQVVRFSDILFERVVVEDGGQTLVDSIVIPSHDGVLLLRPLDVVVGGVVRNATFVRVFNSEGTSVRNGFFSRDEEVTGSVPVYRDDIDQDGFDEIISAREGRITVSTRGKIVTFAPYSERYRGSIHFAVGDITGDAAPELVTGAGPGGGPHVRVFSLTGRLLHPGFMAYNPHFRGGVSIALADWNGDGVNDIITGAGPGGGPHVRAFDRDGRLLSNGFMAFDGNFRGGAHVAAGDVTGDGHPEIVVCAMTQTPRVRVFQPNGQPLSDFLAFSPRGEGCEVAVVDVTGEGRKDIIASSPLLFR